MVQSSELNAPLFLLNCNHTQKRNSPTFPKKDPPAMTVLKAQVAGNFPNKISLSGRRMLAGLPGSSFTLEVRLPLETVMGKRTHHLSFGEKRARSLFLPELWHNAELILLFDLARQNSVRERLPHTHTNITSNKFITSNHKLLFMRCPLHKVLFVSVFTKNGHHYNRTFFAFFRVKRQHNWCQKGTAFQDV